MKNLLLALASVFALAACTPRATELNFPVMPPEMADCKMFKLQNGTGASVVVVTCPNNTTTSKSGKSSPTVVIDGATYQKVEE